MSTTSTNVRYDVLVRHADGSEKIRSGLSAEDIRGEIYQGRLAADDQVRTRQDEPWRELGALDEFDADIPQMDRRKRNRSLGDEEFDMTPMIDVVFLLLIFFMVTASFHLQKGLDFPGAQTDTPSAKSSKQLPGLPAFDDRLILEITADDQFRFKEAKSGLAGPPFSIDELKSNLEVQGRTAKKGKLLILAHESSAHEATVAAIDTAAQVGITDISLADTVNQATGSGGGRIIRTK